MLLQYQGFLLLSGIVCAIKCVTIEQIQKQNIEILKDALPKGWHAFCDAPVDEGVMSMYQNINPSAVTIHVLTINNQSVELPIKALSELHEFNINPKRKTLLYVNGFFTEDSYFSVQSHLHLLQQTRSDLNVLILDMAKSMTQLYYTVRHHATVQGYFVAKVITVLINNGIAPHQITLAGHSVGANIAALGAKFYALHTGGTRLGQLIAIDPATMCEDNDIHIHSNVSERVVVLHGEGDIFGIRRPMGTIDIYPNGVGMIARKKLQPGCDSNLCSHMYSFVMFMEALIEKVMIPAVKCDDWSKFRKRFCDYSDTIAIGLKYPETAKGLYFCVTQPNPPYTYMEHGLRYKKTRSNSGPISKDVSKLTDVKKP